MTILVCAPHPDDEAIGMGGTMAKLAASGERVQPIIFTLGEGSHPWQRTEAIRDTRRKEAIKVAQILGCEQPIFLELKDLTIGTEVVEKDVDSQLHKIIQSLKPETIFMPALDDWHHDHRSLARFVLSVHQKHNLEMPLWQYTVWNPLFVIGRENEKLIVDISKQFRTKWQAINAYESQKISTFQLIPTVMLRGFIHGAIHGYNMAEVFLRAR